MKRVVVTGIGIVSCIGNTIKDVTDSLYNAKSGITFSAEHKKLGFRSHVYGKPQINLEEKIDRRVLRFMGDGAAFNHIAMEDAIKDANLSDDLVSNVDTGIIMGSGGPSTRNIVEAAEILKKEKSSKEGIIWTESGRAELTKVPFFVRGKVKTNTEKYAILRGIPEISDETLYDAKAYFS